MSVTDELVKIQEENKSLICLGLDLDTKKMPTEYTKNSRSMFEFAYQIIENTKDVVCAYKPNMAFFESMGPEGLSLLRLIIDRIPEDIPVILDGKRGDIGNTASHYATALFERYGATWITVNPYMGYDSLRPFLEYKDNGIFILCLTSNNGSKDFQMLNVEGKPLYEIVAEKVAYWNKDGNCGLVVGATQPEQLKDVRSIAQKMPILIPGVGAQGGSLELATRNGTANFTRPAVINVSRSVLYASTGEDFARRAREEVIKLNNSIKSFKSSEPSQPQTEQPQNDQKIESDKTTIQSQLSIQANPIDEPKESIQTTPVEKPVEPNQTHQANIENESQNNNLTIPENKEPQEQQTNFNNFNQNKTEYQKPENVSEPVETTEQKTDKAEIPVEPEKTKEYSNRTEPWNKKDDTNQKNEPENVSSDNMNSEPEKTEKAQDEKKEKPAFRPLPPPPPIPKPPSTLPFGNKPGVNPNLNHNDEDKKED
ncbi:MAG: orotidine-5'-phosphate decarboxylase [candidate division Zixibacteria bacterium]|nr:orotidine-5'-phosphate decarboxylase [candidate division Zixibacteria bacterium]